MLLMLYNLAERLLVFRVRPRGLSCFICNIVHSFVYRLVDLFYYMPSQVCSYFTDSIYKLFRLMSEE